MQFDVWTKGLVTLETECIVLGIFDEAELTDEARSVDSAADGVISKLVTRGDFPGRSGETLLLAHVTGLKATRVLLTGLGAKKSFSRKTFRKAIAAAVAALTRTRIASAAFAISRPAAKDLDDYY